MADKLGALVKQLHKATTEEDVKHAWAKNLAIDYNTSDDHDLYTEQILFEFKVHKNFENKAQLAAVLAQLLYYLRRLKFGVSDKAIPPEFCLADRDQAVIGNVADFRELFAEEQSQFDWDLRPSSPDPSLVAAVQKHKAFKALHVYRLETQAEGNAILEKLRRSLAPQASFDFGERKIITEANFEDVFAYWNDQFGESVKNGFKSSRYFVSDIQLGNTHLVEAEGKVFFKVGPEETRVKKIVAQDYKHFWNLYEKVSNPDVIRGIIAKSDRLTEDVDRRKHGEFFTPLPFARKALDYLVREFGRAWWRKGNFRLWDMAAGSGNLQYHLPAEAWKYLYLSTLYKEDVEHCERLFPDATVFKYDYLNDDVGNVFAANAESGEQSGFGFDEDATWKMPENLRRDLADPKIKWIILINPPFATAQQGGATGANKADVSKTKVRTRMHDADLGEVSRELFAQFLFRIRREFANKKAWLMLFSKLKYINATNDQKFRDSVFQFTFCSGFMFSSVNFAGTSKTNQFPVGVLLWDLKRQLQLEKQEVIIDVFDTNVEKTGIKLLTSDHRDNFLSKWIGRPAGIEVFPPFSSAITVKTTGPDLRDRVSEGFLGSLMCAGNDLQHQNMTALFSGPYASAGGHSITPGIFEQSLVVHAVRRLPKAEWHNDRDQFLQPKKRLPEEFVIDTVVWSLFSNSNNTVALKDVRYKGMKYQVRNHFFPFPVNKLKKWDVSDSDIRRQLSNVEDRFVADWLAKNTLSAEAKALLTAAEAAYKVYFSSLNELRTNLVKIETWDAGWWQIRKALTERGLGQDELAVVKEKLEELRSKILPQVSKLGFLP